MRWEFVVENGRAVLQMLKRFPVALGRTMRDQLYGAINEFQEDFTESRLRGRPGLIPHTRDLIRSFVSRVDGNSLNSLTAWMASRSKYASIQETGGTVRAKKAKYLAIPLPSALTDTGTMRGFAVAGMIGTGENQRQSLRSIPGLFVVGSGEGSSWKRGATFREGLKKGLKGLTFGRRGAPLLCMARGDKIVPLFVLKKQVYIPPRMGLFAMFKRWPKTSKFKRYLNEAIHQAWKKVKA